MVSPDRAFEKFKNSLENEILAKIQTLDLNEDVYMKIKQVVKPERPKRTPRIVSEEMRCLEDTKAGGKCGSAKCDTKCWAHMTKAERDNYIPRYKKGQSGIKKEQSGIEKEVSEIEKEQSEIEKEQSDIKKEQIDIKKEQIESKKEQIDIKKEESEIKKEKSEKDS